MKNAKKMLALLLAVCMLIGLPMAVQANDTVDDALQLLNASEVPEPMANRWAGADAHRLENSIVLYFNQVPTFTTYTDSNNLLQITNIGIRIIGYDVDGNVVSGADAGGKYNDAYKGYPADLNLANPIVISYGNANRYFSYWPDAVRFEVLLYDSDGSKQDGFLGGLTTSTGEGLVANDTYWHSSGIRDAVRISVDKREDALMINSMEVVDDNNIHVGFSEAITLDPATALDTFTMYLAIAWISGYDHSYVRGNGALDGSIATTGSIYYRWNPRSITMDADNKGFTAFFTYGQIATAVNCLQTIRNTNPNDGYQLDFIIAEKTQDPTAGEVAENYYVDGIRATVSNKPLYVNATSRAYAWKVQDLVNPAAVSIVNETTVRLLMPQHVQLRNMSAITVNGQAVTAVTALDDTNTAEDIVYASQYELTVDASLGNEAVVELGADAFFDVEASTISNITAEDTTVDEVVLENTVYNFMNADTGRVLAVDGTDELTLVDEGYSLYSFMIAEKYVDLTGGVPTLIDAKIVYRLRACANGRYQIVVGNGVVADTDEGDTNIATLTVKSEDNTDIATGWYLTEAGGQRPLKVMPFGDSITQGSDALSTTGTFDIGWRDTVSQELMEYFNGRVVFVGPKKNVNTTLSDTVLTRHAGYAGWVVENVYGSATEIGLAGLTDMINAKYAPDTTLLMVGINDLSKLYDIDKELTETELSDLLTRYENLVKSIAPALEDNGAVFASKLTPRQGEQSNANVIRFNDRLEDSVKSLQDEGYAVYLNDNYTGFPTDSDNHGWRESEYELGTGLHMNEVGDAFVTSRYVGMVKLYYGQDGVKKLAKITAQVNGMPYETIKDAMKGAAVNGGTIELMDNVTVTDTVFTLDTGVNLDLNGYELTVNNMMAFGQVVDSTEGEGKLKVAQSANVILLSDNEDLPMYDENGYRFFSYELVAKGYKVVSEGQINQYGVSVIFKDVDAYELLAQKADTCGVALMMDIVYAGNKLDYKFQDSTMKAYAEACAEVMNGEVEGKDPADYVKKTIALTISGLNNQEILVDAVVSACSYGCVSQRGDNNTPYPVA